MDIKDIQKIEGLLVEIKYYAKKLRREVEKEIEQIRQEERERARKIIDEVFLRYDKSCEALGLEKRKFVDVLKQEAIKKLNETV